MIFPTRNERPKPQMMKMTKDAIQQRIIEEFEADFRKSLRRMGQVSTVNKFDLFMSGYIQSMNKYVPL